MTPEQGGDDEDRTVFFGRPNRPRQDTASDATEIGPLPPVDSGEPAEFTKSPAADAPTQITGTDPRLIQPTVSPVTGSAAGSGTQRRKLEIGTVIQGIYRIDGVLKSGGMGAVYRGHEIHTDAPVAIKVILPEFKDDEKASLLFKREASTLRQLADEAIVRYFAYIYDDQLDRYCIVMEFIAGRQLSDVIGERRAIGLDDARALLARLARGLAKAHRIGVVHRDLAPDNVMLRDGDVREAVLIDFGIAKSNAVREATMRDQFAGRLRYTSPEQLGRFNMNIGPHTDVYSLALVMAAALRGTPLDMGYTSMADAVDARRNIPDLPDVPLPMVPLLRHMLEPNPADRPASMERVLELLDDPSEIPLQYWPPGTAPPRRMIDPLPPPPEEPEPEGGRWIWPTILLLLVILGGALTFVAYRGGLDPVLAWWGNADRTTVTDPAEPPDGTRARVAGSREAFLAEWPAAGCTYIKRVRAGVNAGGLDGFAADLGSLDGVADAYARAFGAAQLREIAVTEGQCPALDLARALQGYGEPLLDIVLDRDSVAGSGEVVGRVLDASDRQLWFAVVTPNGDYAELTSRVGAAVGGERPFRFGFAPAALPAEGVPMVLVAVATDTPSTTLDTAPDRGRSASLFPRLAVRIAESQEGKGAVGLAVYRWMP